METGATRALNVGLGCALGKTRIPRGEAPGKPREAPVELLKAARTQGEAVKEDPGEAWGARPGLHREEAAGDRAFRRLVTR